MRRPPYSSFPILAAEKIILRELLESDCEDIVDISFYECIAATSKQHANEMRQKIIEDCESGTTVHWAISNPSTNKIMGTCGYYRGFANDTGEVGCALLPEHRGKGIMTSALELVLDFGYTSIGLNYVEAITTRGNKKAIELLERLGFDLISELEGDEIK